MKIIGIDPRRPFRADFWAPFVTGDAIQSEQLTAMISRGRAVIIIFQVRTRGPRRTTPDSVVVVIKGIQVWHNRIGELFKARRMEIWDMSPNNTPPGGDKRNQFIADARREREIRMRGYREQALKIFPPICARCGREFEGKRLRELTVHHKDHDHDNNPPDGSNWELLCLYCHDNEHSRYSVADWSEGPAPGGMQKQVSTYNPFAGLDALLKHKK